jgi:hypothetical protein
MDVEIALWKDRTHDSHGFWRDLRNRLGFHRHGWPPALYMGIQLSLYCIKAGGFLDFATNINVGMSRYYIVKNTAATILATIGHIANFEDAGHLKSYFGWAPKRAQTGVSFDWESLTKGGSREMKKVMYLVAWNAIKSETEWADLYKRLVPRLCTYDEKTQTYKGKGKALGHVIGRLITLIYALLRQDDEALSHLPPGANPPDPILYDPELHKRHRSGHYRPIRKEHLKNRIEQIEPQGNVI